MDRGQLARLLEGDGEAFAACRHAILGGASFWIDAQAVPASELVSTYARRERHTRRRGIPTLGFTDAVLALRACDDQPVRLGSVDTHDSPYHFQLFINNDNTALIACLAVDQSWSPELD